MRNTPPLIFLLLLALGASTTLSSPLPSGVRDNSGGDNLGHSHGTHVGRAPISNTHQGQVHNPDTVVAPDSPRAHNLPAEYALRTPSRLYPRRVYPLPQPPLPVQEVPSSHARREAIVPRGGDTHVSSNAPVHPREDARAEEFILHINPLPLFPHVRRDVLDVKVNTRPLTKDYVHSDSSSFASPSDGSPAPHSDSSIAADSSTSESTSATLEQRNVGPDNVVLRGAKTGRKFRGGSRARPNRRRDLLDVKVNTAPLTRPEVQGAAGEPHNARSSHDGQDEGDNNNHNDPPRPVLGARAPDTTLTGTLSSGNSYSGAAGNAAGGSVSAVLPPGGKPAGGLLGALSPASGGSLVSLFSGNAGNGGTASSGPSFGSAHPIGNGKYPYLLPPNTKASTASLTTTANVNSNINESLGNAFSGTAGNAAGGNVVQAGGSLIELFSHNAGNAGQANSGGSRVFRRSTRSPPVSPAPALGSPSFEHAHTERVPSQISTALEDASDNDPSECLEARSPSPDPQTAPKHPVNPYVLGSNAHSTPSTPARTTTSPSKERRISSRIARRTKKTTSKKTTTKNKKRAVSKRDITWGPRPRPDLSKLKMRLRKDAAGSSGETHKRSMRNTRDYGYDSYIEKSFFRRPLSAFDRAEEAAVVPLSFQTFGLEHKKSTGLRGCLGRFLALFSPSETSRWFSWSSSSETNRPSNPSFVPAYPFARAFPVGDRGSGKDPKEEPENPEVGINPPPPPPAPTATASNSGRGCGFKPQDSDLTVFPPSSLSPLTPNTSSNSTSTSTPSISTPDSDIHQPESVDVVPSEGAVCDGEDCCLWGIWSPTCRLFNWRRVFGWETPRMSTRTRIVSLREKQGLLDGTTLRKSGFLGVEAWRERFARRLRW
ncbi:hypothetical protein CC1G_10266 [Coprinopsis cinerea okayama7|uniref:Uncharacterized protein n=1 Tax=Coprinopsis cinerea (strain Okayama-7 / 130 / ATCC MYA-4618 / FGSC 9003) TaxID=240176 RepID=A8N168_COPC7|nr:hypothetical protein CC1G_10266 [Coprinopsis cinerea okayama7\|eukprot:XP_001828595.2 hypothetical protein CC1G_10266 [Coprinopsis cinerea okayama7\